MAPRAASQERFSFYRLDVAAICFAVLLSLICLAKGAVHDTVVGIAIVFMLPILFIAAGTARSVHSNLKRVAVATLVGLGCILLLQVLIPGDAIWEQVQHITGREDGYGSLLDRAAWMQGIGRLLLFVITFAIALFIGSSEASARVFFNALLMSGVVCVALTFFATTDGGIPTTTYHSYHHGLVNPNNAAAYLAIMLLVAFANAARFFRSPATSLQKSVIGMIDQLTLKAIVKGCYLLFAALLLLAGLFMTGSRGGILMAMACSIVFFTIIAYKTSLKPAMRNIMVAATLVIGSIIFIWSFANFGQVITDKIETNGASANTRGDIYRAVMPMIADHALLGTGLGSFPGAFQKYRPSNISSDGIIDKAHNSYLEFTAEMGVPGALILLTALGWMGYTLHRGFKERKERYVVPALGLVVWLYAALYSLIDFPLQIPGIAALFIAITTVCVSQTDRRFSEPAQKPSSTAPKKRVRIRKRGVGKPI